MSKRNLLHGRTEHGSASTIINNGATLTERLPRLDQTYIVEKDKYQQQYSETASSSIHEHCTTNKTTR